MELSEPVAIKLAAYTLYCRKTMERLTDLRIATGQSTRVGFNTCYRFLDESLGNFFLRGSPRDIPEAVELIGNNLRSQVGMYGSRQASIINAFDRVIQECSDDASTWDYRRDIEEHHQQGLTLARRFFHTTPWPETQAKLGKEAKLIYLYEGQNVSDSNISGRGAFNFETAPVSYRNQYLDEDTNEFLDDVIFVRFTFASNLSLYLAYPFLFLHEYTAHAFANDYGNDVFNDGWMLRAANEFLHREWRHPSSSMVLSRDQAKAFSEELVVSLNDKPRRGHDLAADISGLLPDNSAKFTEMTYELAAFNPMHYRLPTYWPTMFLNALERRLLIDPPDLLSKIEAASDLIALYNGCI